MTYLRKYRFESLILFLLLVACSVSREVEEDRYVKIESFCPGTYAPVYEHGSVYIDYLYHDTAWAEIRETDKMNWAFYGVGEVIMLTEMDDSLCSLSDYPLMYIENNITLDFIAEMTIKSGNIDTVITPENVYVNKLTGLPDVARFLNRLGTGGFYSRNHLVDSFRIKLRYRTMEPKPLTIK